MTAGIADTSVLIHLFRNNATAITWVAKQRDLSLTPISWLEFVLGAPGKNGQKRSLDLVRRFNIAYLTQTDQQWTMEQMLLYRLRYGVSLTDCLIASVCHRLKVPLYTDNVKEFIPKL